MVISTSTAAGDYRVSPFGFADTTIELVAISPAGLDAFGQLIGAGAVKVSVKKSSFGSMVQSLNRLGLTEDLR